VSDTEAMEFELSSGNVFADLELADADELLIKADLAIAITKAIHQRGLKQAGAAKLLGINQPKVSALMRGHLDGFSIERLIRYLCALQQNVEIVITAAPRPMKTGHATVVLRHGADQPTEVARSVC
jgi:predicted XRE-type DNA-binding protein